MIIGFPFETWKDIEASINLLIRYAGIRQIHPQLHLLSPQPGTAIMEKYGDRLDYDGWFPDRAYFNSRVPEKERKFVEAYPELCSSFYYFPNQNVERRDLVEVSEFCNLLISSLPGLTAFLRRKEKSILDLIARWKDACLSKGLQMPTGNGFFSFMGNERRPYLESLLAVLSVSPAYGEREKSFIDYWKALVGVAAVSSTVRREIKTFPLIRISSRTSVPLDARPVLEKECGSVTVAHDVHTALQSWRLKGEWTWPEKSPTHYLMAKRRKSVYVSTIPRVTWMVLQWCDGRHSIDEICALVDSLEDEQSRLQKKRIGSRQVAAMALSALSAVVGLRAACS
ncbi:hypothetical protein [Prosthecochloris sp. GSB1]|uniref:hypothetical protein n=1 Tax=Prosthecochloris sp. GSB1 TaxID=281093 RepID=UPI001F19CD55|nr:hypothetical protein [Prosthecochloris sp. GSB1]